MDETLVGVVLESKHVAELVGCRNKWTLAVEFADVEGAVQQRRLIRALGNSWVCIEQCRELVGFQGVKPDFTHLDGTRDRAWLVVPEAIAN